MINEPKFLGGRYILREFGGKPCPRCGRNMVPDTRTRPTKDHIIPRSRGGTLDAGVQIMCWECNQRKGNQ